MTIGKIHRLAFTIVLIAFMSGCAGYDLARLPGDADPAQHPDGDIEILRVGDNARITTNSGEVFTGEVDNISSDSVTLGQNGNYGYQEFTVPTDEIKTIEIGDGATASSVAASSATALGIVAVGTLGFLLYAFHDYGD